MTAARHPARSDPANNQLATRASLGHGPDAIFDPVVVDGQISIVQIACERLPPIQAVVR